MLTYHVVPGKVMSTDLSDGMKAETVNGQLARHHRRGRRHRDGERRHVVTADIETANGVIHVIDTVLVPESK